MIYHTTLIPELHFKKKFGSLALIVTELEKHPLSPALALLSHYLGSLTI